MLRRHHVVFVMLLALATALAGCFGVSPPGGGAIIAPDAATLQGTVAQGATDGPPLAGATVSVGGASTVTDEEGRFSLVMVADVDTVTVTVSAPGFESRQIIVDVSGGRTIVLNVALLPLAQPGEGGEDGDLEEGGEEEPQEPARPAYEGNVAVSVRLRNVPVSTASTIAAPAAVDLASPSATTVLRPAAAETYVPGQWIVEVEDSASVHAIAVPWSDVGIVSVEPLSDSFYLVVADETLAADEVEQRLRALPNVVSVGRNQRVYPTALAVTPNDQYFSLQWSLPLISAPYAWNITTGSKDVVVAVLDTGLRSDHPDIDAGSLTTGRNFVSDQSASNYRDGATSLSHGTMVTGIIGARTNNGVGMAGLNWSVSIMPVRVLSSSGNGTVAGVGQGIRWAVDNGAHVINMSLAWDSNPSDPGERYVAEQIEYAVSRGVTIVAGAGNDNGRVTMPAAHPDVIAVGAVDQNKRRAWYSNYGPELDLVAPGGSQQNGATRGGILSTDVVSGRLSYSYQQGTSFASPHVAGVVALMYANGITDPQTVREILLDTAEDLGARGFDNQYGYGLVNAYAAVAGVRRQDAMVSVVESDGTVIGPVHPEPAGQERVAVVEGVAPGKQTVFAWIDVNADGVLDAGDFSGIAEVQVPERGTVSVDLDLYVLDTLPAQTQQRLLAIVNQG